MEKLLGSMIEKFNLEAQRHMERQRLNPFSGSFSRSPSPRLSNDYGKPIAGSKTEERGKKAKCHILKEIMDLCNCIHDVGVHNEKIRCQEEGAPYDPDHDLIVTFKEIFQIYTNINDKVVGLLIAAKKRGFIYFEKEILFQRQDDDVLIALVKPVSEIREIIKRELNSEVSPARNPEPKKDQENEVREETAQEKGPEVKIDQCEDDSDTKATASGEEPEGGQPQVDETQVERAEETQVNGNSNGTEETVSIPEEATTAAEEPGDDIVVESTEEPEEVLPLEESAEIPETSPVLLVQPSEAQHTDDELSVDLSSMSDCCDQEVQRILESNLN